MKNNKWKNDVILAPHGLTSHTKYSYYNIEYQTFVSFHFCHHTYHDCRYSRVEKKKNITNMVKSKK